MDRSIYDPCGCATPFILKENGIFRMWYASFFKWEWINGEAEPYYRICYAESVDGLIWKPSGKICIDTLANEGGIVRPTVFKHNGIYHMWYSYRMNTGYRINLNASYRIGYAISSDGLTWERRDDEAQLDVSEEGWDSNMIAYPYVFKMQNKLIMFYNGNGFGQSGFGYSEALL
jgi:hypothetical protein